MKALTSQGVPSYLYKFAHTHFMSRAIDREQKARRAFTLIEMLAVITVIGILCSILFQLGFWVPAGLTEWQRALRLALPLAGSAPLAVECHHGHYANS